MLSLSSNKSKLFFVSLILLLVAIVTLTAAIFFLRSESENTVDSSLKSIKPDIEKIIAKHEQSINRSQFEGALERINDPALSDAERYKALQDLVFFINTAYSAKHDPALRKYALELEDLANDKFSEYHTKGTFLIICSDPECGQEISPALLEIQRKFNASGVDEAYVNTINKNFETAAYTPDSDKDSKIYGFLLVIDQLLQVNNSVASESANQLIKFMKNEYSIDYHQAKQEALEQIDVPLGEEYAL